MKIISGESNLVLASAIADRIGGKLAKVTLKSFSDGESCVQIEEPVENENVIIIQSTSYPVNDNLMQLLLLCDAARRAGASKISAVIPYFAYGRQDRSAGTGAPISAKLVMDMLAVASVDKITTIDIHKDQLSGFTNLKFSNLKTDTLFTTHIKEHYNLANLVIAAPDIGAAGHARKIASILGVGLAIVDKVRSKEGHITAMGLVGDVNNKDCIIVDDIISSGGTLLSAGEILIASGAASINAYVTHGIFSGSSLEKLCNSEFTNIVITDTIKVNSGCEDICPKLQQISVAALIASNL